MSRDQTPYISFYGKRNTGKSSLINHITGQKVSIVSSLPGTTTDPVKKSMELPQFGKVVLVDTAGIDDQGEKGFLRISSSYKMLNKTDLAVLVITSNSLDKYEQNLTTKFNKKNIPYIVIHNKSDKEIASQSIIEKYKNRGAKLFLDYSVKEPPAILINALKKETIKPTTNSMVKGIIKKGDTVLLVIPIDGGSPADRLILPQVKTIRDILNNNAFALTIKNSELDLFFKNSTVKPALVITDSRIYNSVATTIPIEIPLTSFSILQAKIKGPFNNYIEGAHKIDSLKENDKILISETCTHMPSCNDIGRVLIPDMLKKYTEKNLCIHFKSGSDIPPEPITNYALIIQCGACMTTKTDIVNQLSTAIKKGIAVTNYGMAITLMQNDFERAVSSATKNSPDQLR
ncbi:[FeFe] hydrogenase H-cluster maturation GTPase HydF [Marinilabiliaceae bacterium ANBcel2]|nr:[FeFe] hydrogenase H-cluster maturation GTPase HydF [Marinilabiliaceae bacterium ANBcel2]